MLLLPLALAMVAAAPGCSSGSSPDKTQANGALTLSAGTDFTCAVQSHGTLACWGLNNAGQAVPPSGTFSQVAAGQNHACGLRTDGTLAYWGYEFWQQTPPNGTFTQVSAGIAYTCALRSDGAIACWGDNTYGAASPPTGTFLQITAGGWHACGLRTDGTVACWGENFYGQATPPSGTFSEVSAGGWFTCGLKTDGTIACWGTNSDTTETKYIGQASPPTGTFKQVSAGGEHACALKTDGTVVCWGSNDHLQASAPSGEFIQVSAGYAHTCGIRTDGSPACWGSNYAGQAAPPAALGSHPAPTASETEQSIDGVIGQLFWDYMHFKDVRIDRKIYYTDSSASQWIRFDVHIIADVSPTEAQPDDTSAVYGFMKRAPSKDWELVNLGTGDIQCGLPVDVQTGLGFAACSASEEQLYKALKDLILVRTHFKDADVKISSKAHYTDASRTDWVEFHLLPIPHLTDPAWGFMVKPPGGNWQVVAGPATGPLECGFPADVQKAFTSRTCSPHEEDMDQAIQDFLRTNAPPSVETVIVDEKNYYTDSSGTTWLECGALLAHGGATDQVFGLMKKTADGNWEAVAGPAASQTVWCGVPMDVRPFLGFAPCTPQPTPTAK